MKHGSLFSGIGGFELAAQWMGWENVFHCEINEFGSKVLHYYWPKSIRYEDIKKTDFTPHRGHIDILTGGFPCQPYSVAGKRKGKEDERHLWPEMLRAIREIQPRYIVGENVSGIVSWNKGMVFEEVQTDLEAEGYEVWAFILPACALNAPHRRDRVWFIAYSNSFGNNSASGQEGSFWKQSDCFQKRNRGTMQTNGLSDEQFTTNSDSNGQFGGDCQHEINAGKGGKHALNDIEQTFTPNTTGIRFARKEYRQTGPGWITEKRIPNDWLNFPTQPPICSGNDGLSSRLAGITFSKFREQSIKAYGNAIVPQVAFEIFKAIEASI